MIIDNLEAPYSFFFAVSEIWFLIKESTIKLYFLFKNALHVHNVKCITGQACLHRKSLKSGVFLHFQLFVYKQTLTQNLIKVQM